MSPLPPASWSNAWEPSHCACTTSFERLALWAGDSGQVTAADLEEMIADTSEAAVWTLSDAVIEGDARTALRVGEQLIEQGENVTGLIYGLASRLRAACAAAAMLEEGLPPREVEGQPENAPLRGEAAGRPPAEYGPLETSPGYRDPRAVGALVPRRCRLWRRARFPDAGWLRRRRRKPERRRRAHAIVATVRRGRGRRYCVSGADAVLRS